MTASRPACCRVGLSAFPRFPIRTAAAKALLLIIAAFVLAAQPAAAASNATRNAISVTHVYFIRGFLGIFSTGFDRMSADLARRNIRSEVHGHTERSTIRAAIVKDAATSGGKPNPVILVGHSFGANAALAVAAQLEKDNIKVDLVITVDPTLSGPLSPNVKRYLNYYFPGNGLGQPLKADGVLAARIENLDLRKRADVAGAGDGHWTVTNNGAVQKEIMAQILKLVR